MTVASPARKTLKRPGTCRASPGNEDESGADGVERQLQRPDGGAGGQDVFDLEADAAAVRQRHALQRCQHFLALSLGQHDLTVTDENRSFAARRGARSGSDVRHHGRRR